MLDPLVREEASVEATSEQDLEQGAEALTAVQIHSRRGDLTIEPGQPGETKVRIRATRIAGGDDETEARKNAQSIQVVGQVREGVLQVDWRLPSARSMRGEPQVHLRVIVPRGLAVRGATSAGDVVARGFDTDLKLSTGKGSIRIEQCAGAWDATANQGDVVASGRPSRVALRSAGGRVRASLDTQGPLQGRIETRSGSVELALGPEASVRVVGETDGGEVRVDTVLEALTFRADRRGFEGVRGQGAGRLEVRAEAGSITVR
ncbi:MAG: DUF4097 family beta strand repeat protein [Planctomycetes bacterium]|nr:DUF4097 family beta strand repeat protein [Planctomycetota bacterium]